MSKEFASYNIKIIKDRIYFPIKYIKKNKDWIGWGSAQFVYKSNLSILVTSLL